MEKLPDLITTVGQMPIEHVLGLITLAVVGLAAFAIHAITSIAKNKVRK